MNEQMVYLNTLAEGALVGTPEEITKQQLPIAAKTWKRSNAVVHYKLYGLESISWKGVRKDVAIGDIGCAKLVLPLDKEFSGLGETDRPERLLNHWISATVEDFDLTDEVHPVLFLNRQKALSRLRELNTRRVAVGGQAYGVIQGETRGAYLMNVGGYQARMPRYWYDWDSSRTGQIGQGFEVSIRMQRDAQQLIVSRSHLLPNPMDTLQINRGVRVKAKITHIYNGAFKAEIRPGVRIRVETPTMYRLIHVGDSVMVEVRGKAKTEFFGIVVA